MKRLYLVIILIALVVLAAACSKDESTSPDGGQSAPATSANTKIDPALQNLIKSAEDNPSVEAYLNLGNAYTERGDFGGAVAAYKKGLAINPNHPATLANLGVALYQMGRFDEAQQQFEKALKLNPDDAPTTYLLGATFLQMGDQKNAEAMFQKALTIDATLPEAHFGLGTLYTLQNKKDKAIKEFETFLSGPPAQDPRAKGEAERYLKQLKSGQ